MGIREIILVSKSVLVVCPGIFVQMIATAASQPSRNQAVVAGATTSVICTIRHPVVLTFKSAQEGGAVYVVYNGFIMNPPYRNNSNYGLRTEVRGIHESTRLTILNTTQKDAGLYTCTNQDIDSTFTMHLVVFGKKSIKLTQHLCSSLIVLIY